MERKTYIPSTFDSDHLSHIQNRRLNTRQRLEQYLIDNPVGKINTGELSRSLDVSRQLICSLLDSLGETRHKREPSIPSYCIICGILVSKKATYCRTHSKVLVRTLGQYYQCRICKEYKLLELFAKSNKYRPTKADADPNYSETRYETRCLECRAKWQRDYYQSDKGKERQRELTSNLSKAYPERQRAYYQVYRARQDGDLPQEPCFNCGESDTQAIHHDYSKPLEVSWACSLCKYLIKTIPYTPDPLEDGFRKFVHATRGRTNNLGKWIQILKKHYSAPILTNQILISSIKEYKQINGLGKQYEVVASQYTEKLLIQDSPNTTPENPS